MSLLDRAKADIKRITSNTNGFARIMTLVAPDESTITTNGLHTKHHIGIDSDGNPINTKTASVSISEDNLTGYPVRNAGGEVDLKGHLVTVKDSTGTNQTYLINEWYPDESVGLIVCILQDYAD